eukprot:847512-Ditylum_brightwellii.AAC.1
MFKVEEGVMDKKLGESRMYKLCMQPEEEKSLVHLLAIENMTNVDALYTFAQNLLRGNALTAFNNKLATPGIPKQSIQAPEEEFPTPTGIEAKKLEDEEILEFLENRIPTSWKFQIYKEGFNANSSTIKKLQKPVFAARNVSQKKLRRATHLVRATLREEGSAKPNTKLAKRLTVTRDKILHNIITVAKDVTIASTMGIATTPQKS